MRHTYKIPLLLLAFSLGFLLWACDDPSSAKKKISTSAVVVGKISQPVVQKQSVKEVKKDESIPGKTLAAGKEIESPALEQKVDEQENEKYDAQGKIDPFIPLIQEKTEETPIAVDTRPKRILTPLEKIELSQIRLVAVIMMKGKSIAMVEEANGKGYEVGIGTYIGKNQGRVSEIKENSIVIKELVRDFKGKLKENFQEIKLHKYDNEE